MNWIWLMDWCFFLLFNECMHATHKCNEYIKYKIIKVIEIGVEKKRMNVVFVASLHMTYLWIVDFLETKTDYFHFLILFNCTMHSFRVQFISFLIINHFRLSFSIPDCILSSDQSIWLNIIYTYQFRLLFSLLIRKCVCSML